MHNAVNAFYDGDARTGERYGRKRCAPNVAMRTIENESLRQMCNAYLNDIQLTVL